MNTLKQIEALQVKLAEEISCAELLQSNDVLNKFLTGYDNRIHPMLRTPLYNCVAWVTFKATKELISNIQPLSDLKINTVSGSGFWRYTSIPETQQAVNSITVEDDKLKIYRITEACAETSNTGTSVSFYILVDEKPVKIILDFSYQSKEFKVPYLTENYRYTKNGFNGKKYIGVNGAPDSNDCIGIYSYGTLDQLIPEQVN